jgi:hypothetical protein
MLAAFPRYRSIPGFAFFGSGHEPLVVISMTVAPDILYQLIRQLD